MMKMMKLDKLLTTALLVSITWVLIQVVLLFLAWNHPMQPDELEYTGRALTVCEHHTLYPSVQNLYDRFTHSPGVVNYFAAVYSLFGTFKVILLLNLLMNIIIMYEVFYVAKFFFGKKVGSYVVILYSTIISFWFAPLHYLSDHPAYFLFLTGFCLSLQKKWYLVIAAGLCYALSYTIRPTVLAYLVTSVVFLFISRRSIRYYVCLLIPYFGILYGVGKYFECQMGVYTNTSHITGYGLMHSANEKTWAGPDMSFDRDPNNSGYIANAEKYTFSEKDSIWKVRAIQWIIHNPQRYAKLAPQRFFRSYALDYWSLVDIFDKDAYGVAISSPNPEKTVRNLRLRQALVSVPYYAMLLLFMVSLYRMRFYLFTRKGVILIITLLYTATTFLLLAEHRTHYAFLFPLIIWAGYGLADYFDRDKPVSR